MLMPTMLLSHRIATGRRGATMLLATHAARRSGLLQANTTPAIIAARMLANQIHARMIERLNHFGQRFNHATNVADAGFHPLDGRQRNARQFGQRFLIDPEQRSRRPHLKGRDHTTTSRVMNDK
jgi:hypothetical protein